MIRIFNLYYIISLYFKFHVLQIYIGKKQPAVNNLTFGVYRGECFGLLGVNGAGKNISIDIYLNKL